MDERVLPLPPDLWAMVPALAEVPLLNFLVAAGEAALRGSWPPSLLPTLQRG